MRYYIADCHFFHSALNTKMDKRGFDSVLDMNDYMIDAWNNKVRRNDEVIILGDFSWGKADETMDLLRTLNGKKYLITGNHDLYLKDKNFDTSLFGWIKPYAELNDNNRKVILCHYPMPFYNGQYRLNDIGEPKVYMLYGHIHNTHDYELLKTFQKMITDTMVTDPGGNKRHIPCNMINVFTQFSNYQPLTLDEWIENNKKQNQ